MFPLEKHILRHVWSTCMQKVLQVLVIKDRKIEERRVHEHKLL